MDAAILERFRQSRQRHGHLGFIRLFVLEIDSLRGCPVEQHRPVDPVLAGHAVRREATGLNPPIHRLLGDIQGFGSIFDS